MRYIYLLTCMFLIVAGGCQKSPAVLIVTGGHDYDTTAFFEMFRSLQGFRFDSVSYPAARALLDPDRVEGYDVLVFYDYVPEMDLQDSSLFLELAAAGKPMLFLHHAICSFQHWEGYRQLVGGRYVMPGYTGDSSRYSDYTHDLDLEVKVVPGIHPVTRGVKDFTIHDEGYRNLSVLDEVTPLLTTEHPGCSPLIGWTHSYKGTETIYLLFGHDRRAYENGSFRMLLQNGISWLAKIQSD